MSVYPPVDDEDAPMQGAGSLLCFKMKKTSQVKMQ